MHTRFSILLGTTFAAAAVCLGFPRTFAAEKAAVDFTRDIRPILSNHCFSCHGPDEGARQAGLRLDQRDSALGESDSGTLAIVPGSPDVSELVSRIESPDDDVRMPPPSTQKPLSLAQQELLKRWIAEGAAYADHWAFVAPRRPKLPAVRATGWPRNAIDHLVLKQLEDAGLSPSAEVDRAGWLRRVTLDLTGLPPSPAELDAFLADPSHAAYETAVDRLLHSPRHAERMAMYWLDAARYADTNGYNNDEMRTMWPWRDWVIRAFEQGMPYDQFLTEQLAGDLLPGATLSQQVATGFNRNHVLTTEGGIIVEEYHVEYVADRVHTTGTVFLGLSLQCARCHDHKFDPVSQLEYYRFASLFGNTDGKLVGGIKLQMAEPLLKVPSRRQQAVLAQLVERRDEIAAQLEALAAAVDSDLARWEETLTPQQKSVQLTAAEVSQIAAGEELATLGDLLAVAEADRTAEQRERLQKYFLRQVDPRAIRLETERADIERQLAEIDKVVPKTMVMRERDPPRPTYFLKRGQYDQRGEQVEGGVPAVLCRDEPVTVSSRLELARWLTAPSHPLTARVAVNRSWAMLFGSGLVETAEDFGVQGTLPSHPQLLDWLATELVRRRWDQRAMLKLMVLSATYRQSSRMTRELLQRDPENRLLARAPRYRLPAETVRDNGLVISGLLCHRIGGPSVKPYQPAGLWEDVSVARRDKYVADEGEGLYRRSMYTFWKRTSPPPAMSAFDAPDRETCVVRRGRTNTPLQALVLLNDPTYVEAARKFAERVMMHASSDEERLAFAFKLALCRTPRPEEQTILLDFRRAARQQFNHDPAAAEKLLGVGQSPRDASLDTVDLAAWTTVTSMILNLDETITKQ